MQQLLQKSDCFKIVDVDISERLKDLNVVLDPGESAAIELALIRQLPLIIDEKKGRTIAKQLGLKITGFSGILLLAVRKRVVSSTEAIILLEQAMENGFRLSDKLYQQVVTEISCL